MAEVRAPMPRGQTRADGPACVLGIGTAVPPTEFLQSEYPDFFFNITNCSEKEALKAKFKRICKSPFDEVSRNVMGFSLCC